MITVNFKVEAFWLLAVISGDLVDLVSSGLG